MRFEQVYGIKIVQFYGVSETGVVCGNRHYSRKVGTVGMPAIHQEFRIVDSNGNQCPSGTEGEVTVGGPKLAIGYLRDDGSIDPLLGSRIRTGDLGVQEPDGFVRITGRTKELIVRGGIKIAPSEIEDIVLSHAGVLDTATIGVPDDIYGEEIVCFVVAKDRSLSEQSILEHCRKHLPSIKTPKEVCLVSDLPRSDRGKVLRDKLKQDWIREKEAKARARAE
jgi:acyl-CoA synthetase (AMP-forming)/AMP-acid ligase II